jgi:hypothetical protein
MVQLARCWVFGTVVVSFAAPARAELPLHERIDRAIESALEGPPAAPATDAEFLRRASLDLAGMIPTPAEARAFLDDPSPYKREKLIDRLLSGPRFPRRMRDVFDSAWMERRPDKYVPSAAWRAYLLKAFRENRPYDQIVREMLTADGTDPASRPAAKFVLDREADPNNLTRDLSRLFLGRDMQCAQCHDHPLIDDYKQAHYYGLFAFVSRTALYDDPKAGKVLAEKGEGEVTFISVFKKKVTNATGPRVLDGPPVAEPAIAKGQEYFVGPKDKARMVPTFSRRAQLALALVDAGVPEFDRTIANRLWAVLMGRGLVHPLDVDHSGNPPSHPELLDELTLAIRDMKYDMKAFLREVALTRAYQRSSEPRPDASAEQLEPSQHAVAPLRPLSPEQLGWSTMQALGFVEASRRNAEERYLTRDPKMRDILDSPAGRRQQSELFEAAVEEQLAGNLGPFIQRFAAAPGQPQEGGDSTVHQALFLANGQPIQNWLEPSGVNLTARLNSLTDPNAIAEEFYLSILTRRPTEEERAEVAQFLKDQGAEKEKVPALKELAWALLASTEFRFNH